MRGVCQLFHAPLFKNQLVRVLIKANELVRRESVIRVDAEGEE